MLFLALRTVHISQADGTAGKYEFLNHPESFVQKRMLCLRLKYRGYENQAIADVLEVSRNTIGNYLTIYEQSGIEGLKTVHYQGPVSKLDKHQPKVEGFAFHVGQIFFLQSLAVSRCCKHL